VPALDEAGRIADCLASVRAQPGPKRILVADGGSRDDTVRRAAAVPGVEVLSAPRGRASQMNAASCRARGDILCFLHADTRLPPGAARAMAAALERPGCLAGSFRLAFDADAPLLRFYALCSRINHSLFTYGDQTLFVRSEAFRRIGGFASLPLLEDVEIQRRLRRLGRFVKAPLAVVTSARRFARRGPLRQQALNLLIVGSYLAGVAPERLARLYPPCGGEADEPAPRPAAPFRSASATPGPDAPAEAPPAVFR